MGRRIPNKLSEVKFIIIGDGETHTFSYSLNWIQKMRMISKLKEQIVACKDKG